MTRLLILLIFCLASLPLSARADSTVVFNEIMFHPQTNENSLEWVEFHNQLAVDIDISNWSVENGIQFKFPFGTVIRGRSYLLLAIAPAALQAATGQTNIYGPFTGRLSNAGEELELRNNSGRLVDSIDYGVEGDWPVGPDGSGSSLAKVDRDSASGPAENWTSSERTGGTPGTNNFLLAAQPVPLAFNELSASTNAQFWLEVANYGTNSILLDRYVIVHDGPINNEYAFPAGLILDAGGYLSLSDTQLGFHPVAGDKLFFMTDAKDKVVDGVIVKTTLRGRSPNGTGRWLFPNQPSPGTANSFVFRDEIVINEIMYHHQLLPATNNMPPQDSREAWLELFNRSTNAVNLTGWELSGGISYQFTPGKTLAPGGYLVVADDAVALRALYPALDIVGNHGGRLSSKSDLIVLNDAMGNPADEVRYHDRGRWPEYPDGGGSSLELRDPNADNSKGEAWAASIESGKSAWQNYSYRMVASIPASSGQPTRWNDFILGLLSNGECLIDDINVVESPAGVPIQLVGNGDFENGLTGWRAVGTHGRSAVVVDPESPGNRVLHVIATGAQEHMHNHIETTYLGGRTVVNGREYQISYRAKWLAGNNLLNTRLYFNRAARSTTLPKPQLNGTPGAQNSRRQENIGPTFSQFGHQPVIPAPGEAVTVSVVAQDPQGVATCDLWWSANGGAWSNAPMTSQSGGRYVGTIPGHTAGTIVQFYVRAVDGLNAVATFPALGPDSGALYTVADGQAILNLAHNVRIILSPVNRDLLHAFTNVMSNDLLPCTVVYDEQRAYYDCRVHLRGSQRGRYNDVRTGFHINFPPDDLFRGVHPVMLIDRSGAGDSTGNRQEEIVIKHILNRAGGIPGTYSEICRVIAPRSAHTGAAQFFPRHEDLFIESAFENGGDGTLFEMELIYYPTTANAAGYKNPQPDDVIGTDVTNLGNDKEIYRYNFMIKNHRDADNYSQFVALGKAWSLTGAALDAQTRQLMDIDQWMRAYALISLCSVGDMYTFGNNHNFFMYVRPSDGKFLYFPWDMDFAFSRGSSGALVGDQNLGKIVNLPANLRCLYFHMLDIIDGSFNTNYMAYWTDHYDNFAPGQNYSGSLATIGARATYVKNQLNRSATNSFLVTGTNFLVTSSNLVTLSGRAPVRVREITVNGLSYPVTWTSVTNWTIRLVAQPGTNVFLIQGYDRFGQALTNAQVTQTIVYTGAEPEPEGAVVINEIMYHPLNPDAAFVEIFNASTNFSFDLSNWRLDGVEFSFPVGTVLGSRQVLVLAKNRAAFAGAYGATIPLLGEFGGELDGAGETLSLLRPGPTAGSEVLVDRVRYENAVPWPAGADGTGRSLQLIDATQDNSRVSNWSDGTVGWRFFSFPGTANGSRLNLWLNGAGDVYLDDMALVAGSVPEAGPNLLFNGDFESALSGPWFVPAIATNTAVSSAVRHAGQGSLHLVFNGAGGQATNISVYQDTMPLVTNTTYTLSFWYLPGGGGTNLIARLSSTFQGTNSIRPGLNTPGTNNAIVRSLPAYPPLWLNEVQAHNGSGPPDGQAEREPWVELYNAGSNSLSLDGYYLANQYSNLTQWVFPAGRVIGPKEFLRVWTDEETNETSAAELHANFRLNHPSGSVALTRRVEGAPQILDYLNYAGLGPDQSYGAVPDGQPFDRRVLEAPTPGAANGGTNALPPTVFINEWMAANSGSLTNPVGGGFDDWFELYNPGPEAVDLSNHYLTDNLADKTQWPVPAGTILAAGSYRLVWADGATNLLGGRDLHASLKLERNGEAIGLFAPDGTLIDAVTFTRQTNDISQGRWPDGTESFYFMPMPTPRGPNMIPGGGNHAPVLASISQRIVAPEKRLLITNIASDTDGHSLSFTLGPGAPAGAKINATNGLFSWLPRRGQAPSTNLISVIVSDHPAGAIPSLSATQSFNVILGHWLELAVGTNILRTGQSGSVPMQLYCTAGLTNLEFAVETPSDHLTNWALGALAPTVNAATLESVSPTQMMIRLSAAAGQSLQGTQQLGQLSFLAQSNRPSAFVPLAIADLAARSASENVTNFFPQHGRVVVIGEEPLLEANRPTGAVTTTLTVFGKPGTNYVVEQATNWMGANSWTRAFEMRLDGLFKVQGESGPTNHPVFFRAYQE